MRKMSAAFIERLREDGVQHIVSLLIHAHQKRGNILGDVSIPVNNREYIIIFEIFSPVEKMMILDELRRDSGFGVSFVDAFAHVMQNVPNIDESVLQFYVYEKTLANREKRAAQKIQAFWRRSKLSAAARIIQVQWKRSSIDPSYSLTRKIIHDFLGEMNNELKACRS